MSCGVPHDRRGSGSCSPARISCGPPRCSSSVTLGADGAGRLCRAGRGAGNRPGPLGSADPAGDRRPDRGPAGRCRCAECRGVPGWRGDRRDRRDRGVRHAARVAAGTGRGWRLGRCIPRAGQVGADPVGDAAAAGVGDDLARRSGRSGCRARRVLRRAPPGVDRPRAARHRGHQRPLPLVRTASGSRCSRGCRRTPGCT